MRATLLAIVAIGTCAAYGGIHAMAGNPTGAMGLRDYLGHDFRSKAGLPIVNVPGCPVQPDNFMETLLYLLYQLAGVSPPIALDDASEPEPDSLRQYAPTMSPAIRPGRYFCFWASVPNM